MRITIFRSAVNDTQVAFEVLANGGVILWHDYATDAYFHGMCGVPEALNEFSKNHQRSIYSIRGTRLAIYSEAPGWETSNLSKKIGKQGEGVWNERQVRG